MKVVILYKDGNFEVKNISCENKDIEISSWEIVGDCITSVDYNNDNTMKCVFNDAFGYNIYDEAELKKYENVFAGKIFGKYKRYYGTVVIVGNRNGKNCDIRKRDVEHIKGIITNEETSK